VSDVVDGQFGDERSTDYADLLAEIASATSDEEIVDLLRSFKPPQSRMAQQQLRGKLKKALSETFGLLASAVSPSKLVDAWITEMADPADAGLQGSSFIADDTIPWADAVDLAEVLDEVRAVYDSYVYAIPEALDALALWATYTHVYDRFDVSPILDLTSPTKRCGKSSTIVVTRYLAHSALLSGNISPAALFRAIEAWSPTLLIDEADTFAAVSDELRGILNAGHTRDTAFVLRAEGEGNDPRLFSTFAPKVVAAIGHLPDTIEDRSVRIPLSRKPPTAVRGDAFDSAKVKGRCEPIRQRMARAALDVLADLADADVVRPAGLHDRAWNNWRPLLTLATLAGPDWYARAAKAAAALTNGDGLTPDRNVLALQHVHEALQSEPSGKLSTEAVLLSLVARDDAEWARYWSRDVSNLELRSPAANLAKFLAPFGVRPRQLWIGERNVRGYDREDFEAEDVAPYLSSGDPEKDARTARDARTGSSSGAGSSDPSGSSVFSEDDERDIEDGDWTALDDERADW
jgi:hypothetical protein